MDNLIELKNISASLIEQLRQTKDEFQRCPAGYLTEETKEGKPVLIMTVSRTPKRERYKLSGKPDIAVKLVRKYLLQKKLDALEANIKMLEDIKEQWCKYDPEALAIELKSRFKSIDTQTLKMALEIPSDDAWANEPYDHFDRNPEDKKHYTSAGVLVRSKSEAIIAETLLSSGISFRYEQALHIGGFVCGPDFTIRRKRDGKIFYWEHFGLVSDPNYVKKQLNKIQLYISNGITPWDNLIMSYDNAAGELDIRAIKSEINTKLI